MLTVITTAFARPDYVELMAAALRVTVREPYRFVVLLQPGGLRREWSGVDAVVNGGTTGYMAWTDALPLIDGPTVILHDDCVPVLPWDQGVFPLPHCQRFNGSTLFYHATTPQPPMPVIRAMRVHAPHVCPPAWTPEVCAAAAAANVEQMLDGVFLHIDKGTIARPDSPANAGKSALVEAIAAMLGVPAPAPLTGEELAKHPGRMFPARVDAPGLGDMVASGLSAIGITKERVQRVASAVGIKDCGCAGRQAKLNSVGRRLGIGGPSK